MTTGSYNRSFVHSIVDEGTLYVRDIKSWSGDNDPPDRILYPDILRNFKIDAVVRPEIRYKRSTVYYWNKGRLVAKVRPDRVSPSKILEKERIGTERTSTRPPARGRKRGEHNYTMTRTVSQDARYVFRRALDGIGGGSGIYPALPDNKIPAVWTQEDDFKLLEKLRNEIAGSDFNAGVVLGESGKTLGMLAKAANTLRRSISAAKSGNFVKAAEILQGYTKAGRPRSAGPAKDWLELQYGWKPLLKDIADGMIFIDHKLSSPVTKEYRATRFANGASGADRNNYPNGISLASGGGPHAYDIVGFPQGTYSKRIRFIAEEVDIVRLSGLLDVESVAWELLPYSFIWDWFFPVGKYLSARGLASALKGTFVTTVRHKFQLEGPFAIFSYGVTQWKLEDNAENYNFARNSLTRTVQHELPMPMMVQQRPLGKTASWLHLANASALFAAERNKTPRFLDWFRHR